MRYMLMPERREAPGDPMPKPSGPSEEGGGPRRPETGSPDKDNLLKRMRKGRSEASGALSATHGPINVKGKK
jgi:hypothetical protein